MEERFLQFVSEASKKKKPSDVQTFVIDAQPLANGNGEAIRVTIEDTTLGRSSVVFRNKNESKDETKEVLDLLASSDEEEDNLGRPHKHYELNDSDDSDSEMIGIHPLEEGDLEDNFLELAGGYVGPEVTDPDVNVPEEMEVFHVLIKNDGSDAASSIFAHPNPDFSMDSELIQSEMANKLNIQSGSQPMWSHFWHETEPNEAESNTADTDDDTSTAIGVDQKELENIREQYQARLGRLPTAHEERQELETFDMLKEFEESQKEHFFAEMSTVSSRCRVTEQCLERYSYRNPKGELVLLTDQAFQVTGNDEEDKKEITALVAKQAEEENSREIEEDDSDSSVSDLDDVPGFVTRSVPVFHSGDNNKATAWKPTFQQQRTPVTQKSDISSTVVHEKPKIPKELLQRPVKESLEEKKLRKKAIKQLQSENRKKKKVNASH